MVYFQLFGGASLQENGDVLSGPATQRHRLSLLAVLAVSYPRGLPRERLMALLWPERNSDSARKLLNQAVHALRRSLQERAIVSAGDELRLAADALRCDVIAFEQALAAGELEQAVALHAGPFLDGFFPPNAPELERWVADERERLRRSYCKALEDLAQKAAAGRDQAAAAEWWRRLLSEEPYSARITLRLMEALVATGNSAAALQQARAHALLLQQEFGAEPDPVVMELAERIRAGAEHATVSVTPERQPGLVTPGPNASPQPATDDGADAVVFAERQRPRNRPGSAVSHGSRSRAAAFAGVLLVLAFGTWTSVNVLPTEPAEIRRIAVLPLANLTGDPQQEYFVAGMHDALIAELAQIEALTVYSRQSVLRYQGSDSPLPVIARELKADALVEGSVFKSGDTVRITVQLIRAEPEAHLWAGSHQGPLHNALSLQSAVARAIAHAVRAQVVPEVAVRLARQRAVDPQAQQAYLRGLYHLERGSYGQWMSRSERLEEHRNALRYLEEAVALDPEWAAAHAKLAMAYHWMASGFAWENEAEYYPKAKAAALRALALDETEAQAHASLGFVLHRFDWDWESAERSIRRALELDPNSHHWIYALYLQAAGRHEESIAHFRMAEERNPLSEVLKVQVANAYACAARYEEAIAQADELHARMEASGTTHPAGPMPGGGAMDFKALQYSMTGRHVEAIAASEEAVRLTDSLRVAVANLAFVYARAGRHDEARALAARVKEQARLAGEPARSAHLYAALGDIDSAVEMMEATYAGHRGMLAGIRCSLGYRLLRDHPRVEALIEPVRFPH